MKRLICIIAFSILLAPAATFAASREQQEMQRDIAQLQDQVRALQSSLDQRMAQIQTLLEQSLDRGDKTSKDVAVLSSGMRDTIARQLADALRPIAGLTAKVDNLSNDSADVKSTLGDLTEKLNTVTRKLNDLNDAVKVLQAPPAPPPSSNINPDAVSRNVPPPPASVMWDNAMRDYASRPDLAAGEFADFVRAYPDDPSAPKAQIYMGQIHLVQMKYDQAEMDFDAVIERYPESKDTPDAYFLKGMALKSLHRNDAAADQFRTVIRKYPKSDRAPEATAQLKAIVGAGARPNRK